MVEYRMAISGVTESLAPSKAACKTPSKSVVGILKALIMTYDTAPSKSPGVLEA